MKNNNQIIKQYYDHFNAGDLEAFISLLDEQIIHEINQGETQVGKESFYEFMKHMQHCYDEKVDELVIMANEDNNCLAAQFVVKGVYKATDADLVAANNQPYTLTAGAFFEIENEKITRVTSYYNFNEWLRQVELNNA